MMLSATLFALAPSDGAAPIKASARELDGSPGMLAFSALYLHAAEHKEITILLPAGYATALAEAMNKVLACMSENACGNDPVLVGEVL
jgi:hypothetical protein